MFFLFFFSPFQRIILVVGASQILRDRLRIFFTGPFSFLPEVRQYKGRQAIPEKMTDQQGLYSSRMENPIR